MDDFGWVIPIVVAGMIVFCVLMMGGRRRMMCMGGARKVREDKRMSGMSGMNAIEVLERRLAEGDLTVEDYRERRAVLTGRDADS